jgi:hypothetical protein
LKTHDAHEVIPDWMHLQYAKYILELSEAFVVPIFALRLGRPHCFVMDFQAENTRPPPGTPESPASKKGGSPGTSSSGSAKPDCKLVDCNEVKKTGTPFCADHSNCVRSMRNSAAAKDKKFKVKKFTEEFDLRMTTPAGWRAHHIVQHLACLCVGVGADWSILLPCTRVDAVVVGGATVGWQLSCAAAASVKLTSGLSYILVCQVLSQGVAFVQSQSPHSSKLQGALEASPAQEVPSRGPTGP